MSESKPVIIPFSKLKIGLLALACLFFITLGFFFILAAEAFTKSPLIHSVIIIRIIGFLSVALFGYFLGLYITKIGDKRPGIVIDEKGITDHSTYISIGLIHWQDIKKIYKKTIVSQKYIIVEVKNPEHYIGKTLDKMKIRSMKGNLKLYGSPIMISSNALKYRFKDLEKLLEDKFREYVPNNLDVA